MGSLPCFELVVLPVQNKRAQRWLTGFAFSSRVLLLPFWGIVLPVERKRHHLHNGEHLE